MEIIKRILGVAAHIVVSAGVLWVAYKGATAESVAVDTTTFTAGFNRQGNATRFFVQFGQAIVLSMLGSLMAVAILYGMPVIAAAAVGIAMLSTAFLRKLIAGSKGAAVNAMPKAA